MYIMAVNKKLIFGIGLLVLVAIIITVIILIPESPPSEPSEPSGEYLGLIEPLDELSPPGDAQLYQTSGPRNCAFNQGPCAYNIVRQDEYTCTFNKPIDSRGIAPGSHFDAQCTREDGTTYTGRFRWKT